MKRLKSLIVAVCALVGVVAFAGRAAAETRPYFATGAAAFTGPTTFVGTGYATHLGRYTETGTVAFSPTGNPAVLHVEGAAVYTSASGEELHAAISGELNAQTGVVTVRLTYAGGTGRFVNASGSSALAGQLFPDGTISISVGGTIDY